MERGGEQEDEERRPLGGSGLIVHRGAGSNPDSMSAWPTVDGALGLSEEDSIAYARSFFRWGFFLLPWLWAVNCFYFWPVLLNSSSSSSAAAASSSSSSFPRIRPYVVGSAIGFAVFSVLLLSWALTFAIGGERLFGPVWEDLVMYNVADRLGLTGWN